jgi:hypothetical protein
MAVLLRLADSFFCGLAPLTLPSRLKPQIAMLILSSFSTSFFKKLIKLFSQVSPLGRV